MKTGLMFSLVVLFFTFGKAQQKFDKIFINETNVIIGNILNETESSILFLNIESGEKFTLFKQNLSKIIRKDGTLEVLHVINENRKDNIKTSHDLRDGFPDYNFGFYQLDIISSDPEYVAEMAIEDLEEWDTKYIVIRILDHYPEFFWFQLKSGDISSKTILMRLPIGNYRIEFYEWLTKNMGISTLINEKLEKRHPPYASDFITIENYNTTQQKIERNFYDDSNILFKGWGVRYTYEKQESTYLEQNLKKFKNSSPDRVDFFHNMDYSGTY